MLLLLTERPYRSSNMVASDPKPTRVLLRISIKAISLPCGKSESNCKSKWVLPYMPPPDNQNKYFSKKYQAKTAPMINGDHLSAVLMICRGGREAPPVMLKASLCLEVLGLDPRRLRY